MLSLTEFTDGYQDGVMTVSIEPSEGLNLFGGSNSKTFNMATPGPHVWDVDVKADVDGVYFLNIFSEAGGQPRSFSVRINMGVVTQKMLDDVMPAEGNKSSGGKFANINRPTAGSTHEKLLPIGDHDLQLYSLGTPNGVKVTIMLEELLAAGVTAAEYDAWLINIGEGDQFGSGFVDINPNSKIPALMDRSGEAPQRVFESGSILMYLAEKFGMFLPESGPARTECLSWLFWQMGSAPYLGGGFGHFYAYAPMKIEYCIDRFSMETKRQLDVLDQRLAGDFLDVKSYTHLQRWTKQLAARPAFRRGQLVNRYWDDKGLKERHSASDFDGLL